MKIIFATNNEHKLREVQQILGNRYELLPLSLIGCNDDIPETADTLEGNALQKARYVHERFGRQLGLAVFADDTGLEVEALDGAPGVHTARYAGPAHDTEANVDLLLANMQGKDNRRACFRTTIAIVHPDGREHTVDGRVDGEITGQRLGEGGFGYDPVFRPDGHDGTFAQLGEDTKNSISHRARAVEKLVEYLNMTTTANNTSSTKAFVATLLLMLASLLPSGTANAQEIGKWTLYHAYGTTEKTVAAGNELWTVSNGNLWVCDTETDEIEAFDRLDGLNDVNIQHIAYSKETKSIIVAYESSNIDIIDAETRQVFNIPNIMTSDMSYIDINDINAEGHTAWVSTVFGVVKIDLDQRIIVDTYRYDSGITSACMSDLTPNAKGEAIPSEPTLFISTKDGVFCAPASINLHDISQYKRLISGQVKNMRWWKGYLICTDTGGSLIKMGMDGTLSYPGKSKVTCLAEMGDKMLMVGNGECFTLNDKVETARLFSQSGMTACTAVGSDVYVAAGENGLLHFANNGGAYAKAGSGMAPSGPRMESFTRLRYAGSRLLAVTGGGDYKGAVQYPSSASWFDSGFCTNFDKCVMHADLPYHNLLDIVEDPANPNRHFLCAFGGGLLEYNDATFVQQFHADNSILNKSSSKAGKYTRVCSLDYDDWGNLWMTNADSDNAIFFLKPDGEWGKYPTPLFKRRKKPGLIRTRGDYVWAASTEAEDLSTIGLMGIRMNGTPTDTDDDNTMVRLNPITQQDGLNYTIQHYYDLDIDSQNQVWIGTDMGLFVIPDPDVFFTSDFTFHQIKINRNDGSGLADYLLNGLWCTAVAIDAADRKWVGTDGQGVYLISADGQEEILHFTTENSPLPNDHITAIAVSKETGEVAISTAKGMVTYVTDAQQAAETLDTDNIVCYPNPVPHNYHGNVNIKGLTMNAEVKIATVTGQVIYRTRSNGGTATWNCRDARGQRVATGVYNVIASEADGSEAAITRIVVAN